MTSCLRVLVLIYLTHMMRKPPQSADPDALIRQRLQYLYARRSVVDQLIRTLELYEELEAQQNPRSKAVPTMEYCLQEMAS